MIPGGMSDLTIPEYDPPSVRRLKHDHLCPSCSVHGEQDCACDCLCDFIADVRDDERRALRAFLHLSDMRGRT